MPSPATHDRPPARRCSLRRCRFSLQVLLLAVTLAAAATWWIMLPTYVAHQYVHAINTGDFAAADRMCSDAEYPFPGFFQRNLDRPLRCRATLEPLTWRNMWRGTRDISTDFGACSITATRSGVDVEIWWP